MNILIVDNWHSDASEFMIARDFFKSFSNINGLGVSYLNDIELCTIKPDVVFHFLPRDIQKNKDVLMTMLHNKWGDNLLNITLAIGHEKPEHYFSVLNTNNYAGLVSLFSITEFINNNKPMVPGPTIFIHSAYLSIPVGFVHLNDYNHILENKFKALAPQYDKTGRETILGLCEWLKKETSLFFEEKQLNTLSIPGEDILEINLENNQTITLSRPTGSSEWKIKKSTLQDIPPLYEIIAKLPLQYR